MPCSGESRNAKRNKYASAFFCVVCRPCTHCHPEWCRGYVGGFCSQNLLNCGWIQFSGRSSQDFKGGGGGENVLTEVHFSCSRLFNWLLGIFKIEEYIFKNILLFCY
jgi:hypothetical protein